MKKIVLGFFFQSLYYTKWDYLCQTYKLQNMSGIREGPVDQSGVCVSHSLFEDSVFFLINIDQQYVRHLAWNCFGAIWDAELQRKLELSAEIWTVDRGAGAINV